MILSSALSNSKRAHDGWLDADVTMRSSNDAYADKFETGASLCRLATMYSFNVAYFARCQATRVLSNHCSLPFGRACRRRVQIRVGRRDHAVDQRDNAQLQFCCRTQWLGFLFEYFLLLFSRVTLQGNSSCGLHVHLPKTPK